MKTQSTIPLHECRDPAALSQITLAAAYCLLAMPGTTTTVNDGILYAADGAGMFGILTPDWTATEQEAAYIDGWAVMDVDSTGYLEVQRIDATEVFDCDGLAVMHVADYARKGSLLHQRALTITTAAQAGRTRPTV